MLLLSVKMSPSQSNGHTENITKNNESEPRIKNLQQQRPFLEIKQIISAYNFPINLDGNGQRIGMIQFGGRYNREDLQTYFGGLGITPPDVRIVSIDGANANVNANVNKAGLDTQFALNIEVVGTVAPRAKLIVYFAPPFTEQGFINAITTAVHDTENRPSILFITWGRPECKWTEQARKVIDRALQDAVASGITVLAASGEGGSSDGEQDGNEHVDYPASSPWVTSCGGTKLVLSNGSIISETSSL